MYTSCSKLLMNEERGARQKKKNLWRFPTSSPLGARKDSAVIKGELHRCNTSKSSLAKKKRKKNSRQERKKERREIRALFLTGGEMRLKSNRLLGFGGEKPVSL